MTTSNASELYKRIQSDPDYAQTLFRKALQDPQGTLSAIREFGSSLGLPVTEQEIKLFLSSVDDLETKSWLFKARGGL